VERNSGVVIREPELLLTVNIAGIQHWDLHPDGKRYLFPLEEGVPVGASASAPTRYLLLQNWLGELQRLVVPSKQ
jgi:hypothetical protein